MAYEIYLAGLERITASAGTHQTPVKISVLRSYSGVGSAEMVLDGRAASSLKVAVFGANATPGTKALVVVPVRPLEEIDDIADGTSATAIGTLEVGHAVALKAGNRTILPAGPAARPALRVPKL